MRRWAVVLTVAAAVLIPLTAGPLRVQVPVPEESQAQVESKRFEVDVEITHAPAPAPRDRPDLAKQLFLLTNEARRARGLVPMTWWSKARLLAAEPQTDRMVAAGKLFHNPGLDALLYELRVRTIAENVGMGPNVASIQRAFMRSKGHRENILEPSFTLGAVSVVQTPGGVTFATVVFGRPLRPR